jgi:pSer/pThr/pTyr-binding forkhead associated (FHA) protein
MITTPDGVMREISVPVGDLTIGRGSTNSIVIPDAWVSSTHAVLRSNGQTHRLIDLGSRNGVFVNGEQIAGSRLLAPGDKVRLGLTQIGFALPEVAEPPARTPADDASAVDEDDSKEKKMSVRMRAARIDFVGRVIAQIFTVIAALIISAYLFGSMPSGCAPGLQ